MTVCGVLLATVLFVYEMGHFWHLHRVTKVRCLPSTPSPPGARTSPSSSLPLQMSVDLERRHDLLISLAMDFPSMPCAGAPRVVLVACCFLCVWLLVCVAACCLCVAVVALVYG